VLPSQSVGSAGTEETKEITTKLNNKKSSHLSKANTKIHI